MRTLFISLAALLALSACQPAHKACIRKPVPGNQSFQNLQQSEASPI